MNNRSNNFRIFINLSEDEARILSRLGNQSGRSFRTQAYYSLRQNLIDLGLIQDHGDEVEDNKSGISYDK